MEKRTDVLKDRETPGGGEEENAGHSRISGERAVERKAHRKEKGPRQRPKQPTEAGMETPEKTESPGGTLRPCSALECHGCYRYQVAYAVTYILGHRGQGRYSRARKDGQTGMSTHIVISATIPIASTSTNQWPCMTLRLLWRVARADLKEYPGVLKDPLAPSDSCGVAARAVQKQCSGVLGNPLTLSDSCGSVARAVPSVLAGGTC
ncbi:hypothetical protein NDU88_006265 [Pleurodeles waltl]|uniref:Uncharacterized protein n=1 Tax=Pleurodeles waltl TaxID=8319 RepID=A0AAV7VPC4_PLEWA|nr:hypothetical protein NDU88_006265 [Pleurodeles waltl]